MMQSPKTQKKTNKREIDGILPLDKPSGLTSNRALQSVKYALMAKKAGHTGSLDPLATGLLPLCFGEATKVSQYLLDADKKYNVTARLGSATDTADSEGQIIANCALQPDWQQTIMAVLPSFIGASTQIPPMYSALKVQGKPLYELARQGITLERAARGIVIHAIDNIQLTEESMQFDVHCSKGTYIRTLVEDIAIKAGHLAHVIQLRRTKVGSMDLVALTLEDVLADPESALQQLVSIDTALAHFPEIILPESKATLLCNGGALAEMEGPSGIVRLYNQQHRFLGIGTLDSEGVLKSTRLVRQ